MKNKTFKKVLSFVTVCSVVSTMAFTPIVKAEDIEREGEKSDFQEKSNEYNYEIASQLEKMLYAPKIYEELEDKDGDKKADASSINIKSPVNGTILDTTKGDRELAIGVEGFGNVDDIESIEVFADGESLGEVVGNNINIKYTPETSGKTGTKDVKITAKATLVTDEIIESEPVNIKVKYEGLEKLKVYFDKSSSEEANEIQGMFNIINEGLKDIDLNDIKIRYYYILNSNDEQSFYCDNAVMTLNGSPWSLDTSNNISGKVVRFENELDKMNAYLEISFNDLKENLNSCRKMSIKIGENNFDYEEDKDNPYGISDNIVVINNN